MSNQFGEAKTIRIDDLPPDNTQRFLSRDIAHFAALVAFFIGAATSLVTVWIESSYAPTMGKREYYSLLIGVTLLLVIVEFVVLFWLSLRTMSSPV